VKGAGAYVKRKPFSPVFEAMAKQSELAKPTAVNRG